MWLPEKDENYNNKGQSDFFQPFYSAASMPTNTATAQDMTNIVSSIVVCCPEAIFIICFLDSDPCEVNFSFLFM